MIGQRVNMLCAIKPHIAAGAAEESLIEIQRLIQDAPTVAHSGVTRRSARPCAPPLF